MNTNQNNKSSLHQNKILFDFQSSPTRKHRSSPHKISGWEDDQNHFLVQNLDHKSKNIVKSLRINPTNKSHLKYIIKNEFSIPKIKNSMEAPEIILRLKQQLKGLQSPKKKPNSISEPVKMRILEQSTPKKKIKQKNLLKIQTQLPRTLVKRKRLIKNTIFDLTKLKIRKERRQKNIVREFHTGDYKHTEFNDKLIKIQDHNTTPIRIQKKKIRTASEMPQINPFSKQKSSLKINLPEWPLNMKVSQSKTPLVKLYKMIVDENQNQQYRKHLETMLLMSRIK